MIRMKTLPYIYGKNLKLEVHFLSFDVGRVGYEPKMGESEFTTVFRTNQRNEREPLALSKYCKL